MNLKNFTDLKKNLKKDFSKLQIVKLAMLGDSATQLLTQAIKGYGYEVGINFEIFEADYNQIERQVFDITSDLYQFKADFVIIFHSAQKLLKNFCKLSNQEKSKFSDNQIEKVTNIYKVITSNQPCKIIYFNFPEIFDNVFGNYSNKTEVSFIYQLRKFNYNLMNLGQNLSNLFINDLCTLHSQYGHNFVFDPKVYLTIDMVSSIDFLPILCKNTVDIIQAILGKFKKCLILDLDNTLWGGIIGDDGIENIQIGSLGIGKPLQNYSFGLKN